MLLTFVALDLVFPALKAKRFTEKTVSEMTYFCVEWDTKR